LAKFDEVKSSARNSPGQGRQLAWIRARVESGFDWLAVVTPDRGKYWARLLARFVSVQLVVQALGLVGGLLTVRLLDKTEYAYFHIANVIAATMMLLSDTGIGMAILSMAGQNWQDKQRLGRALNSAAHVRSRLAITTVLVTAPVFIFLAVKAGAGSMLTLGLLLLIVFNLLLQLEGGVLGVILRLRSEVGKVQLLDLSGAVLRLALLLVAIPFGLHIGWVVATLPLASLVQYLILQSWLSRWIDTSAPGTDEDKAEIYRNVRRLLPTTIFYALQGQISTWLITIFGKAGEVSDVGALGRIAVIFGVVNTVLGALVAPMFARCLNGRELARKYSLVLVIYTGLALLAVLGTAVFHREILWVLGPSYQHLRTELILMIISTALGGFVAAMWQINLAKAWADYAWVDIPLRLLLQVILLRFIDLGTVKGVLLFSIFSTLSAVVVNALLTWRGFRGMARQAEAKPALP
jgi:O-antigen/teichoic acid export membrane protein